MRWLLLLSCASVWAQSDDLVRGKRLYEGHCALCHGQTAAGGRGPNLTLPKLKNGTSDDAMFGVIRRGVPGTEMPNSWQMTDREIRQVVSYIKSLSRVERVALPGLPDRGRELYAKSGCGGCHILRGEGTAVGPELSEIGASRSPDFLRRALTDPAADLPDGYRLLRITPAAGPSFTAQRLNEDSFTLQVRTAPGKIQSLRKLELKGLEILAKQSGMPSYGPRLSSAELDDLVAYLASLRGEQ